MDMKKRVAVIGFGFMGETHAFNIMKNEDLKLVAIVDKDPHAIERILNSGNGNLSIGRVNLKKMEEVKWYSSLEPCLENEKLDAVHICVHTDLHYEKAKKALGKGLHVLVEKPLCLDIRQGEELVNLAKGKGLTLMVAHVARFMPPYQKLKAWIEGMEFGKLKFLSLNRFSGLPDWGQWKEKQETFGSSGGALFDLVIHDIDYALYILGVPKNINNFSLPGRLSNHDYINTTWEYPEKEVSVKIEGGNIFHSGFPFQAGFIAQFDKASTLYSTLQPETIFVSKNDNTEQIPAGDLSQGYFNEVSYFAKCIQGNSQPLECMPGASLETIKICNRYIQ